jgi:hypothetical protein
MIINYKIVSICRTNFESALAGKPIQDISVIESFINKHVSINIMIKHDKLYID